MVTATGAVVAGATYKVLPISDLKEAPYNPRRSFDDDGLKALADSLKAKGQLVALLVRPLNGHFEIVGGARRYRAAKLAGLKEMTCQVREIATEREALEAAIADNLERQDVSPIEQAQGFHELTKRGVKPEEIAKRFGLQVRAVYNKLELLKLAPPVLAAIEKGQITQTHGTIISRLAGEKNQLEALKACTPSSLDEDFGRIVAHKRDYRNDERAVGATITVRALEAIVTKLKLGEDLLAQRDALIARGIKAVLVAGTYGTTRSSIVLRESAWNSAGKKKCGATKTGILVDNSSRGKRGHEIQVCTSRDCKVHNKGRTPSSSSAEYAKWQERQRREDEARDAKRKREEAIRWEVLNQIAAKVPTKPGAREWTILFDYLKDLHHAESVIEHFKVDWKKPGKAKAVAPCIVMLTLLEHVDAYRNDKVLRSIAKKYGVNYNAAIKAIDKKRKAAAMGAPPAPKDGKYEEPTCTKCGCTETSPCDDGCAWLKLDKKTNAGTCTACGEVDA